MLKITLVTLGIKMPAWVNQAVLEFSKRLSDAVAITIVEIPLIRRGKSTDIVRIMDKEKTLMAAAIPSGSYLIALDIEGSSFTSEQLAARVAQLQQKSSHLCILIGGPEGLSKELLHSCQERWSLSRLTLPHTIVRIVVLEALYRAWSILHNHPYHK